MNPELCPGLVGDGVGPALEPLTTNEDARISDAARGTLLHLGLLRGDAEAERGLDSSVAQLGGEGGVMQEEGGAAREGVGFDVFLSHKRSDAKVRRSCVEGHVLLWR